MKKSSTTHGFFLITPFIILYCMVSYAGYALASPFPSAFGEVGDERQLETVLERAYQEALNSGINSFIPYSLLLIRESRNAVREGDLGKARIFSSYAYKFSPDSPPARMERALARWRQNKLFVHVLITGCLQAYFAKFLHFGDVLQTIFLNVSVLICAFVLTLATVALLAMKKFFVLVFHDCRHVFPESVPDKALWGMILLIFVFPLFLSFSLFWLFLYWLLLLYSYYGTKERYAVAGIAAFFVFVIPLLVYVAACAVFMQQSELLQVVWNANHGYWNEATIERLEEIRIQRPEDQEILFSLGLLHKKEKNYTTSLAYYSMLLESAPENYKARINMGNVYLASELWDKAVAQYRQVIADEPGKSAAAHFNLARAYQQRFMFKEAEDELAAAKKIDGDCVDAALQRYSEQYNRLLIDETLDGQILYRKGYDLFAEENALYAALWDMLFMGARAPYGSAGIIILLLALSLAVSRRGLLIAVECRLCGRVLCKRCQQLISRKVICHQCRNFISKQDRASYKDKEAKGAQIKRYIALNEKVTAILSCIVPGSGHVIVGRTVRGLLYLFLFFTLLCKVLFFFFMKWQWDVVSYNISIELVVPMLLLAGLWLFLVYDARGLSEAFFREDDAVRQININRA